jgi:hypothetical protein
MKLRSRKKAILASAIGALLIGQSPVHAEDAAAENRLLKQKLKQLEAQIEAQARMQRETQAEIKKVSSQLAKLPQRAAAPAAAPAAATPAAAPAKPIGPSWINEPLGIAFEPLRGPRETGQTALQSEIRGIPVAGSPSLYINGVSITPGGFLAAESVFRTHYIGADIATPYQNIPFGNVGSSYANEFRFSARQSRVALLAQGDVNPTTHLSGYFELDFLGAAQTANSNESNSFNPRIRQVFVGLDQDDWGLHLIAGQSWSMTTMTTKGIIARKENLPLSIDAQYVPGFVWARQPGIRLVKDFNKTLWFGLSAENPQTTYGCAPVNAALPNVPTNSCVQAGPTVAGLPSNGVGSPYPAGFVYNVQNPVGGSLFNNNTQYSLNNAPDLVAKVAWDPTFGDRSIHVEAFGLFRSFYSRVNGINNNVAGGGFGGSILAPVIPKYLDFQFSGMTGRGIGRYGAGQLPDVTFNSNGTIAPIQETMLLAGLIWHALPGLDLYTFAGSEIQGARYNIATDATGASLAYGWGNPLYTNLGCSIEGSNVCSGNNHQVRQITGGFWNKIYDGRFGSLRAGVQYSFTQRISFPGVGGSTFRDENMVLTSLRYYPF